MAKIFLADSDYYVVASDIDNAVSVYNQERKQYPETIEIFKDDGSVFLSTPLVVITPSISPIEAATDGAITAPAEAVYMQEGTSITFTATPSVGYTTFVQWEDGSSNVLSVDNPYTFEVSNSDISLVAVFSA